MPESTASITPIPADQHIQISAIIFPRMDQIDLTGPFAVLSRLPNSSVQLVWKDTAPLRDFRGLGFVPDATFADAKPADLLLVPGGPGQEDLMADQVALSFIAAQAKRAKCIFSICTGALVCGAAGLLNGRFATTHWRSVHLLKYFGATTVDQRVVVDGKVVCAAGLTAGIDGALTVAAHLRGEAAAKAIQLEIQYAPEPPFDCGSPASAPAEMVARSRNATAALTAQRLATAKRIAAKLQIAVSENSGT
ncbi:MAG TPA: DJ-1/PfpI family protein [Tepidisphaeraceae bacterium]|nr:DJ-1/PfpI family protein [Tepidisphaeraceae bacterium]